MRNQRRSTDKLAANRNVFESMMNTFQMAYTPNNGNVDRQIRRAMRTMGVTCKQPASPTAVKRGGGRRCGRCSICPTAKDRKTDWKYCCC